jgi:hypothetical protein
MAIKVKGALKGMTKGADLLHPKLSLGYVLAAIVAVAVLLGVWKGGGYVYSKVSKVTQGLVPSADAPDWEAKLGI